MDELSYKKVMIIDDSKLDRFTAKKLISLNAFAELVVEYGDAREALAELQSLIANPELLPEVIFLDIHMPVMDGFTFLDHYEKLPTEIQDNCSIVMISSTNSPEDFARIRTYSSVRKFFGKPIEVNILGDIRKIVQLKPLARAV